MHESILLDSELLPDIISCFMSCFPELHMEDDYLPFIFGGLHYNDGYIVSENWSVSNVDEHDEYSCSYFINELSSILQEAAKENSLTRFQVIDYKVLSLKRETILINIIGN